MKHLPAKILFIFLILFLTVGIALAQTTQEAPVRATLVGNLEIVFLPNPPPTITFPAITLGSGSSTVRATPAMLQITVTGHHTDWEVTYSSAGLTHSGSGKTLTNLTIDAQGTWPLDFPSPATDNSPFLQGGDGQDLIAGATIIYCNGPGRGAFVYQPAANILALTVNDNDDVVAGTYEGTLTVTITGLP